MRAFQEALVVKNPPANAGDVRDVGFDPWVRKIPWRRERLPTPVFWPGEFHGLYSLGVAKSRTGLRDLYLLEKSKVTKHQSYLKVE